MAPQSRMILRDNRSLLCILLLAFAIAFYRLDVRTWHGDELGSVVEGLGAQSNPQSPLYFWMLGVWMQAGVSEFWLRSLSAFFTVLSVAINYRGIARLGSARAAFMAALLLSTSALMLEYGQQVRFYTLFLAASSASIWSFVHWLNVRSRRALAIWIACTLWMLTTHLMAFVVVGFQVLTLWFVMPRLALRYKFAIVCAAIIFMAVFISSPWLGVAVNWVAKYTNIGSSFVGSRGVGVAQLAKVPLTFFFFTLGQYVYPLNLPLVLPGLIFFALAIGVGIYRLRASPGTLLFLVLLGLGAPLLLYLVFDALVSPGFTGASPRFLIYLLPVLYFLTAWGIDFFKRPALIALPFLLINLFSMLAVWQGDWSYSENIVDWRSAERWLAPQLIPQSVVVLGPRAQVPAPYYFPSSWRARTVYDLGADPMSNLQNDQQVVLVSASHQSDHLGDMNNLVQSISGQFELRNSTGDFPLILQVYQRKPEPNVTTMNPQTGQINLPASFLGLEFADLKLPVQARINGQDMQLNGGLKLPLREPAQSIPIALQLPTSAHRIWFASNWIGTERLTVGASVGAVTIWHRNGNVESIPLRAGYETASWDDGCVAGGCNVAAAWHKRLALVGAQAYPASWRDFQAHIFAYPLQLASTDLIQRIEIQPGGNAGTMYVWGLMLEP